MISTGRWRFQWWNYALLGVTMLLILSALAVLLLVSVKLYFRVIKGNQSLGISLLFGILLLYLTAFFFVFDPADVICRVRIVVHSLAYTICFGVMIAKATQLRNAETLGFANSQHISYWNYWLLLFFIVGVQIALSVRWLTERVMAVIAVDGTQSQAVCVWSREEFLLSQTYVVILLLLALFINSRNRNIKRNYKETKWLFLTAASCVSIWILWMLAYLIAPMAFKDTVVVVELLCCATVMLGFLFGPKIYILLSYEPVIVEYPSTFTDLTDVKHFALFGEKESLETGQRAVSPSSSESRRSNNIENNGHSPVGKQSLTTSSCSDDQMPIFRSVMRKKSRVHRSNSEHDQIPSCHGPSIIATSCGPSVIATVGHRHHKTSPPASP